MNRVRLMLIFGGCRVLLFFFLMSGMYICVLATLATTAPYHKPN